MVEVEIRRDRAGKVVELSCSGHAGFDDGQGLDLVCAAVSALTGALGLGFSRLSELSHRIEVGDGRFRLCLEAQERQAEYAQAQFLLQTVTSALEELAAHYPGFICVRMGKKKRHE